jgi:predicted signal transduction protein with EAL and GGDEF domain
MDVIAEGVETEGQLTQLKHLGCEYGQGYFFARPLAPADAEAFLESRFTSVPDSKGIAAQPSPSMGYVRMDTDRTEICINSEQGG